MSVLLNDRSEKTSNWATRYLISLLNPGRVARRPDRLVGLTSRLGVTALEDRVTPATLHWLGSAGATGNLWSVPANWQEGRAPLSGDRLAFDTTAVGFSVTANGFAPSNDVAGLTNLAFAVIDASPAGDFAIGGNAVGLTTSAGVGVTSTVTAGAGAAVNNGLTLGAATTVAVGLGSLTLGGAIDGAFPLAAAGSPAGTLVLGAANTYSGGTLLTSGTLAVGTSTSLGSGTLTLNGGTLSNATSFLTVANPFVVAAPSTIAGGNFFTLDGNGALNATLSLAHTGFLTLNGALSGPGGLSEIGFPGSTTLGGTAPNTFGGGTKIVHGGVTLQKTAGVRALASPVTITGTFATLKLAASNQLNGTPVALGLGSQFSTNGFSDSVASLTGLGGLDTGTLAAAGLTVTGGGGQLLTGPVTGAGSLTYSGAGSLTLAGPSTSYTGTLTAATGSLVVSADFSGASAIVTGGTLGGTGVVKSVAATGGFINTASSGTGGTLNTASGSLASSLSGATFRADLGARGPSDHLALGANATLDLTGAALALNPLAATFADTYYLVTSPTGGLSGTFTSLPDASTLTAGGQSFRINYTASAVTLTNLGAGSRSRHWTGAVGGNWSTAGNWAENSAPASGDTLVFDTSTPGFAASAASFAPSNDVAGLTDLALVINDASTAGDFTIGGSSFGLSAASGVAVTSTVAAGTAATLNNALRLGADTTVNAGLGTLTFDGAVSGGFALAAAGSPAGTLVLNVANTYSGGTVVISGTVSVGANGSLGTGTLTLNGGTLANTVAFLRVPNPFVVSAPSTVGGGSFFDLDGGVVLNADLRLTNTGFLALNGAVSGAGGLIEDGFPGSTTLSGTSANTYTGPTTILSGTLTLKKTAGVVAVASPVSLAGGSFPTLSLEAPGQLQAGVSVALGVDSTFKTGGFNATVAALSGIGSLDTGSTATAGLTVTGGGTFLFTGPVSGSGLLRYTGSGAFTLGGASPAYTGQLVVAGGSLLVSANFSGATALTQTGGTLGGPGIVKTFLPTGTGTFNPGGTGVGSVFSTAPGAALASALTGETFQVDLSDTAPSDQLVVGNAATVNLANSTLSVNLLRSTFGAVFTIVSSGTGGISGTFTGLPDNATFAVAGRLFRIRYTASAVTLTDLQSVTLSPSSLPVGEAGVAYSQAITSTGGAAPVTLAVSGVTNTTGLTISGSGTGTITLIGTPTSAGTVTFTVTPTDALGTQAGTVYSVTINPPVVLTPSALPAGEVGLAYNQAVTSTGGTAPVTLAVSGVTNTTGLTIAGSGTGTITVSGTPTTAGTVTFTVTPSSPIGTGLAVVYSFTVNPAVVLSPATLPAGEVGVAYNQAITSTGGAAPVTLALSNVTNTTGLTISGSGTGTITLTGRPTAAGTVTFTVTPTGAAGTGASTVYTFAVGAGVVLTPSALPVGEVGLAYSRTVTASGGSGPIVLTVSGVTNATGLTIAGSGTGTITVSGTPSSAGAVSFTVTPTDAVGTGLGTTYTVTVSPAVALSPAALPVGQVGLAYGQTIGSAGGVSPVTLTLSGVTNATGLTISGSGTSTIRVNGNPTAAGTVSFTVTAADALGGQAVTVYSFAVSPPVVLSPSALPIGEVGVAYSRTISPTGGAAPVTLVVSGVTNATGVTISGTGTGAISISGTPTAAGTVTFTVTPTGAAGAGAGTVYTFTVSPAVVLSPSALPVGEVGLAYSRAVTASGGAGAVTLALSGVTNATGLTIAGSGTGTITVSGTPSSAGAVSFTVTPTDAVGTGPAVTYTFAVSPPVVLSTSVLPVGKVGVPYAQTISSTGGATPVTLALSNVTNATGLTIAGSGTGVITLSGRPTAAGTVTFTVTPTGAAGAGAGTVYTFAVTAAPASLVGSTQFAVGADGKGTSTVTLYKADRTVAGSFDAFPGFTGGVRTAAADFNGDGVPDVVAGTGPGGPTRVRVLDGKDGRELFAFDPFEAAFTGGVFVAAGDLTGDGVADLVVTPDEGGGPRVRVFDGKTFAQLADFFGIDDPAFRGGARAGVGDITGDGVADLVVAAGFGGGPRVAVFDGTSLSGGAFTRKPFPDFFAFEETLRNGVYVAAGDIDGDGKAELIAGGGPGGGPRVSAFSGAALLRGEQARVADYFAGDTAGRGGVRVAAKNLDGDERADIVVGSGAGAGSRVAGYAGRAVVGKPTPDALFEFDALPGFSGGVYVG